MVLFEKGVNLRVNTSQELRRYKGRPENKRGVRGTPLLFSASFHELHKS